MDTLCRIDPLCPPARHSTSSKSLLFKRQRCASLKALINATAGNNSLAGQIEFSGILTLLLIGGKDMVAKDITGTSDPYVIVASGPANNLAEIYPGQSAKSSIQWKTLNPIWNETLTVSIVDLKNDVLHLEVWDKDNLSSDDAMPYAVVYLKDVFVDTESTKNVHVKLQGVKSGTLFLALTFVNLKT